MKKETKRNTLLTAGALLSLAILTGGNEGDVDSNTVETIKSYSYDNNKSISLVNDLLNKQLPSPPIKEAEVLEEVEVVEPIKEVIEEVKEDEESSIIAYEKVFNVSFYSADYDSTGKHKEDKYYGVTASGNKVKLNHTLACPKSMPFGTKVEIEGIGIRYCEDRGSAITNGKLDVYVESEKVAYSLGRKYLYAKVYKKED